MAKPRRMKIDTDKVREVTGLKPTKGFSKNGKKLGRPSGFTDAIGKELFDVIVNSAEGLKTACATVGISYNTVCDWLYDKNHPFTPIYNKAKELQQERLVEEMLIIAKNTRRKDVQRDRLIADTIKWIAARAARRSWGDNVQVEATGNAPVTNIVITDQQIKTALKGLEDEL